MGVLDGQAVSAAITNPAFINKNIDDEMPNTLAFTRALSGPDIADIQRAVNNIYTATGVSESQTGTDYNAPSNTISNGDSYLVALTKLANKFEPATGHMHTGTAGDAPLLEVVRSINAFGTSPGIFGDVTLVAGTNMTIVQSATGFLFSASGGGGASITIAASGNPPLTGDVVLVAGTNVSLSQVGQNITITSAATGGAIMTDWDTTRVFTLGTGPGTVTNSAQYSRRVGDSLQARIEYTTGTISSGQNIMVTLPGSISIDYAKISSTPTPIVGTFGYMSSGGAVGPRMAFIDGADTVYTVLAGATTQTAFGKSRYGTDLMSSGDSASWEFTVPIAGWSANA